MKSFRSNPSRQQHPLFIRMFLRECAWFLSWKHKHSDRWIWQSANYSLGMFLAAFVGFVTIVCALALRSVLPENINPLNASQGVSVGLCIVLGAVIVLYVEYRTREFKDNVDPARKYMTSLDRVKWWLTPLLGFGFIGGTLGAMIFFA